MSQDPRRYDDIIHLPHHQSATHPHMSRMNRAAQFSPFAALSGYEDSIEETRRLTRLRKDFDESEKQILDQKFQIILEHIGENIPFTFTIFIPDQRKEGGSFSDVNGIVKKVNLSERTITLYAQNGISDGALISIDQITDIRGTLCSSD